jgi:phospholipase/lecithinase/hemolysin
MRHDGIAIGELSGRTGCNIEAIRYERVGLLPSPERRGRYRSYTAADVRLTFARWAPKLGFTLDEVRTLLALSATNGHSAYRGRWLARAARCSVLGVATFLCLAGAPVPASAYSAFYIFGDSLSDVGNVFLGSGGAEPLSPYYAGEFSNGPVWAQDLAFRLGLGPLAPSLAGGTDYAFGSATTSNPSTATFAVPTLTQQIGIFVGAVGGLAPASALYSVWIGGSDLLNILSSGASGPVAIAEAEAAAQSAATDVGTLINHGARNVLVPLAPDIGVSPAGLAAGAGAAGTLLAETYNAALQADTASLGSVPGLKLSYLDTFALVDAVVADPGAFGFTNVTDPCYIGTFFGGGSVCATPDSYLFWDMDHPTAAGHAVIAAAADALVPEPGTMGLLAAGLAGIAVIRRRHR